MICVRRKQDIEWGESREGAGRSSGEELQAEQLEGFPRATPADGAGREGIVALFNHSTCKGVVKKHHYCVCREKRRWFRNSLQSRCTKYGSIYLAYYWIL